MKIFHPASLALLLITAICASCKSSGPKKGEAVTQSELDAVVAAAVDPRQLAITVHRSPVGPLFVNANRPHPGRMDEFDLVETPAGPAPIFATQGVNEGAVKYRILVDFRSKGTWTDFDTATVMGIKAIGPRPYSAFADHLNEGIQGYIGVASTFWFSPKMPVESALIYVRPFIQSLGLQARGWEEQEPKMVLGTEMLRSFKVVQVDFPAKKFRLKVEGTYKPDPARLLAAIPVRVEDAGLNVDGIMDAYRGPIFVDLAGRYEAASGNPTRPVLDQVIIGDYVRTKVPVEDSIRLGLLNQRPNAKSPDTLQGEKLPSIGYGLLKDLIVTLDNTEGKLFLEAPPSPSEP